MAQIKVYARPRQDVERSECFDLHKNTVVAEFYEQGVAGRLIPISYNFKFTQCFGFNATQEEVFRTVAIESNLLERFMKGYNATIFAYGQTASGKSYTIEGVKGDPKKRGLVQRSISHLFQNLKNRKDEQIEVHVSYIEIYQETAFDLLNPVQEKRGTSFFPRIQIREGDGGMSYLQNLSILPAPTERIAQQLFNRAVANRQVAETSANLISSRSHGIFTVYLTIRGGNDFEETTATSKLHVVDLAGSERVSKTKATGKVLKEAQSINLSLHYLEQVIMALQLEQKLIATDSLKTKLYIPYRNSQLTMLLRDSLGGNCVTAMIANLHLSAENLGESISTCRFAQRVAMITNFARRNELVDEKLLIKKLKTRIRELEAEIEEIRDVDRGDLNDDQRITCNQLANDFLEGHVTELSKHITTTRQYEECLLVAKQQYQQRTYELNSLARDRDMMAGDVSGSKSRSSILRQMKSRIRRRRNQSFQEHPSFAEMDSGRDTSYRSARTTRSRVSILTDKVAEDGEDSFELTTRNPETYVKETEISPIDENYQHRKSFRVSNSSSSRIFIPGHKKSWVQRVFRSRRSHFNKLTMKQMLKSKFTPEQERRLFQCGLYWTTSRDPKRAESFKPAAIAASMRQSDQWQEEMQYPIRNREELQRAMMIQDELDTLQHKVKCASKQLSHHYRFISQLNDKYRLFRDAGRKASDILWSLDDQQKMATIKALYGATLTKSRGPAPFEDPNSDLRLPRPIRDSSARNSTPVATAAAAASSSVTNQDDSSQSTSQAADQSINQQSLRHQTPESPGTGGEPQCPAQVNPADGEEQSRCSTCGDMLGEGEESEERGRDECRSATSPPTDTEGIRTLVNCVISKKEGAVCDETRTLSRTSTENMRLQAQQESRFSKNPEIAKTVTLEDTYSVSPAMSNPAWKSAASRTMPPCPSGDGKMSQPTYNAETHVSISEMNPILVKYEVVGTERSGNEKKPSVTSRSEKMRRVAALTLPDGTTRLRETRA